MDKIYLNFLSKFQPTNFVLISQSEAYDAKL